MKFWKPATVLRLIDRHSINGRTWRIIMLAHVYDALRSARPYKKAFTHAVAHRIITEGDGRTQPDHFDPFLLKVFDRIHPEWEQIFSTYAGEDSK